MIDDVVNSITQMFAPPLRAILWRSIALAVALIVVGGIALQRVLVWLLDAGGASAEATLGPHAHTPVAILAWVLSFAAGVGVVVGSVMLMPAVTALVGGFFSDRIGEEVEREYYPADPLGQALPLSLALWEGIKTALMALVIYLVALPLILLAGAGAVIFFLATAYILGRQYFELAAMRFRPPTEAKLLRKHNATMVYIGGLIITAFVSIPIVNLATPIFAMALMVHMHKRVSAKALVRSLG
jgi:CysZ protein